MLTPCDFSFGSLSPNKPHFRCSLSLERERVSSECADQVGHRQVANSPNHKLTAVRKRNPEMNERVRFKFINATMGVFSWSFVVLLALGVKSFQEVHIFAVCRQSQRNWMLKSSNAGNEASQDVFLVGFDGCLADTREWRIQSGIDTACQVWPKVSEALEAYDDRSWLENKLRALAHVLSARDAACATCEYALAVRMLLEEQELDAGRSNGLTGKYASRFHPKQERQPGAETQSGTRPLTVGEISANWDEGGLIRETLLTKYHIDYKYPLPLLQKAVEESEASYETPKLLMDVSEVLSGTRYMIAVDHPSDLAMAEGSLASLDVLLVDGMQAALSCDVIPMLIRSKSTVRDLLEALPQGSTLHVIDASWSSLKKHVRLFGDNIPRLPLSVGRSEIKGKHLALWLAAWAGNSHPNHGSAATMNPWTHSLTLEELHEQLASRTMR